MRFVSRRRLRCARDDLGEDGHRDITGRTRTNIQTNRAADHRDAIGPHTLLRKHTEYRRSTAPTCDQAEKRNVERVEQLQGELVVMALRRDDRYERFALALAEIRKELAQCADREARTPRMLVTSRNSSSTTTRTTA